MKLLQFVPMFLLLSAAAPAEESANQTAIVVIQKYFSPADDDKVSHPQSDARNVRLRLNKLMASDRVSEEVRICYAISLIDDKIHLARLLKSSITPIPHEEELLKMRERMLIRLDEITATNKQ